jgi:DNA-binding HxlR family transcriptional regulator
MAKPFEQYCPVAHALGLVGDRWSLLIVRDLLNGAKRYTDLLAGLPGIGTNILAARLRALEDAGIVAKRRLPPPAASTVYDLTDYGAELREVFFALARWGARSLGPPGAGDELYPEWGLNAAAALFAPEEARGIEDTYVLKIGDDTFTVRVEEGQMHAELGEGEGADVVIETDMKGFFDLASGDVMPGMALERGLVKVEGDRAAFERCFQVLTLAPRTSAAA